PFSSNGVRPVSSLYGTISATARPRSVMTTVSPAAARRTYLLSLFFRIFSPTLRIDTQVAPRSFFVNLSWRQRTSPLQRRPPTTNNRIHPEPFAASAASLQQNLS